MLKNNTELDVQLKIIEEDMTQTEMAKKIGTTPQYLGQVIKRKSIINPTFIKILDVLGYDIELKYVKKQFEVSLLKLLIYVNSPVGVEDTDLIIPLWMITH